MGGSRPTNPLPALAQRGAGVLACAALSAGLALPVNATPAAIERNTAMFEYLAAEVAAQRGETTSAVALLVRLARDSRDPKIARRAIELAIRARALDPAIEAGVALAELEPDAALGRELVSQLIASTNDLPAAAGKLASLLEASRDKPRVVMQVGHFLSRFPNKAAVLEATQSIVSRYSRFPESCYAIAVAAMVAGDAALAQKETLSALKMRPGWQQAALLHAQILRRNSLPDAVAFQQGFVKGHPQSKDVWLQLGRDLTAARRLPEARGAFRAAEGLAPDDAQIPYALGLLALQAEDYLDAKAALERAVEKRFADTDAVYMALGQAAEGAKQPGEAIEWYGKVEADRVKAQVRAASVISRQQGLDKAREHLREIKPGQPDEQRLILQAEAQLLREAKAWREAFEVLSGAIEQHPDAFELLYDRAMVAERLGETARLEADLRRVIELKPDYAHAYNALGYTLADRNERIDEAYALIAKAVALAPEDPFILDSLGWVEYRRGNLTEAAKHLRAAYDARPDPEIAAHLGEVLWQMGDRDEAKRLWRASLADNPDHEGLRAVIQKFQP